MNRTGLIAVGLAGSALVFGVVVSSLTVATSGPALVVMGAVELRRRSQLADRLNAERSVLLMVDRMISGLRSGLSLRQACVVSGDDPRAHQLAFNPLAPLFEDLRNGVSFANAAQGSALVRTGGRAAASARLVVVTLAVLARNGGAAIPALQRLRHALTGAEHGRRRADAESAQASASAGLLIAAPALFASAVAGIDPAAAHLYLYEPVGAVCVFCAVVLSWCGWWWMQYSITRVLRSA